MFRTLIVTTCLFLTIFGHPIDQDPAIKNVAIDRLTRYGYLSKDNRLSDSVNLMQRYAGIPVTGRLDEKTIHYITKPRCQIEDMNEEGRAYYLRNRNAQMKVGRTSSGTVGKWNHSSITWSVVRYESPVNQQSPTFVKAVSLIREAFNLWEKAVPNLRFYELTGYREQANIQIRMTDQGFKERTRALGYSLFPVTNTPSDGDIYLNKNVLWWIDYGFPAEEREDFMSTVLHEIGHALGLKHSPNQIDLMYPYNLNLFRHLPRNDARRANSLYAEKLPSRPPRRQLSFANNRLLVGKKYRKRCFRNRFGDRMMRPREDAIPCTQEDFAVGA